MSKGCSWLEGGLFIDPSSGGFRNCCRSLHNYDNLKASACKTCALEEEAIGTSMRLKSSSFSTYPNASISTVQVTFSNFCNLKCRYCNQAASSSIAVEVETNAEFYNQKYLKNQDSLMPSETFSYEKKVMEFFQQSDLSNLRDIGIFGGEPFMARHIMDFFELLAQKTDLSKIKLQINTNASIFPKQPLLDILLKFGTIDLRCSNESVGTLSEYIRSGSDWKVFEKNTLKWQLLSKEHSNLNVRLHMTNNVLSLFYVNDFFEWMAENNLKPVCKFAITPYYMNPQFTLTTDERQQIIDKIDPMNNKTFRAQRNQIIKFLNVDNYSTMYREQIKNFITGTDKIRKESLKSVNPEIYNILFNSDSNA